MFICGDADGQILTHKSPNSKLFWVYKTVFKVSGGLQTGLDERVYACCHFAVKDSLGNIR